MPADYHPLPLAMRAALFDHLATMEQSGLPPDRAFALLRLANPGQARLEAARKLIARGIDIGDAGLRSGLFSNIEAKSVRAALHAGSPLLTYRRLAACYAERVQHAAAFKARMLVPLLILVIALALRPLPSLLIGTSGVSHYLAQTALPLLALAALYRRASGFPRWRDALATPGARRRIDAGLLRVPLFGRLIERANLRDFAQHLAILLEAGVPMFDALPLARETMSNSAIRADHARVSDAVRAGATLAQALSSRFRKYAHVFPHPSPPPRAGEGAGRGNTLRSLRSGGLSDVSLDGSEDLAGAVRAGEAAGRLPETLMRHAAAETAALSLHYTQLAAWLPRLLYALLLAWIGYGILSSKAFMPGGGTVP